MSQEAPLAEAAPEQGEVVETAAPAQPEVDAGSGNPAGAAPAPDVDALKAQYEARINGLMSSFNKLQAEHEAIKRSQLPPEQRIEAEKQDLEAKLESIQGEFALLEIERAIDDVVRENPVLDKFRDLIVAESPEEVFELAQHLSARLGEIVPATPATTPPTQPEVTAPVVPGSPPASGIDPDALAAAMDTARKTGDWGDFFRLKESVR